MAQKSFNHISDETQQVINDAIKASGLTDKEWIAAATEVWNLQAMKTEIPDFRKEIEEVEGLTNRIRNVLINLAQRTAFEKDDIRRYMEEALEAKRQEIENLHVYQAQLEKDVKAANEEVVREQKLRADAEKYAEQVKESANNSKALAESYKEKNEALTDLVTKYKAGHEEAESLRLQLGEANRSITALSKELQSERESLEVMAAAGNERVRQLEERHEEQKQRLAERQQTELDKKDVEREREVLRVRTELQEQSTAEIRSLYERIERLRGEHDQAVEYMRKDHEKRVEALQAQMATMKAEYERRIAELKNSPNEGK
ncbi:hypothetical protein ACFQI7_27360 [Paenibacillus allorhizosphaerae]|uniref:Uncharacterized protein n=1 Tax=Paenibacillus allorhizosphaerae TaxID=2849866 RepID=A0ABM8VNJ1_9BACL|nr:hypothetical protein [Paenibacillus allorhizosphaerae]CAG7651391.1 hypothetical protein PAECIP111802_04951 [Paenibacillus allorhizosphaerae]